MRRGPIVAVLAALISASSPSTAQQTRDARPLLQPLPVGTGAVSGMVVTGDAVARPLRMANVLIIGAFTGALHVTSTDASGRFSFTDLPADRYVVGASRPPFLGAVAGAKRPGRPGTPIALAEGQRITDVIVLLPPGASIAGVLTDPSGQPAVRAAVAVRQWRMQGAERALVTVSGVSGVTDERGRYRLYGFPPGEYVVVAQGSGVPNARRLSDADVDAALKGGAVAAAPAEQSLQFAPVYFPGTTRASDAAAIALGIGEDRQGIDFRMETVRTARVEGTVVTSDGQPVDQALVQMTTASGNVITSVRSGVAQDGRFAFTGLVPDTYQITATPNRTQPPQFASVRIDVEGTDQAGITVTLGPPLAFTGRLVFDGTSPPALAGRRIPLRNVMAGLGSDLTAQISPTTATGAFEVTRVSPGRYMLGGPLFFGATNDSVTWALQSVVVDGRDVTDLPFDVDANQPPRDVVVTYGDRWQGLTGRLQLSTGTAATDYTVIVFPADRAYWLPGSRRILTSRPGTDGQYVLSGPGPLTLPAGEYLLAAVTDIGRDEQFDPAFLASLAGSAVRVTIGPGEPKRQDLVIR